MSLIAAGETRAAPSVAMVVPCYRVAAHVLDVIAAAPDMVSLIICVDDCCPEGSGDLVERETQDPRVVVVRHDQNRGVGAAMMTGYLEARRRGARIAVKIDGDGQMPPALIPQFVRPIMEGRADYTKGNRFFFPDNLRGMPLGRVIANAGVSFLAKLSTGYWDSFDPTNGYTALHLGVLERLRPERVSQRYFFESDLLYRLNVNRCVVRDIPMAAVYGDEISNLRLWRNLPVFVWGNLRNFVKRIVYSYFLRDFQIASLCFLLGPPLILLGAIFGAVKWWISIESGEPATAGEVMIGAMSIITGLQLALTAFSHDFSNVPRYPLHRLLEDVGDEASQRDAEALAPR